MGQFAKHIYIKNSAGTIQAVNLYSTAGEAGNWRIRGANVDGQDAYIPCVPYDSTESRRTSAVFTNAHGTWRFATVGTPPYATAYYTGGSGSFTVPEGVTRLRVSCVGGGSGGADLWPNKQNWMTCTSTYDTTINVGGGTTYFGNIAASGAGSGVVRVCNYDDCSSTDEWGNCISYRTEQCCINISTPGGYHGGVYQYNRHWVDGAGATPIRNYLGHQVATAGAGGGWNSVNDNNYGYLGASGYRTEAFMDVTPGQVIPFAVGGGGACYVFRNYYNQGYVGNNGNPSGGASSGAAGAIFVEWGQGIQ